MVHALSVLLLLSRLSFGASTDGLRGARALTTTILEPNDIQIVAFESDAPDAFVS